MEKHEAKITLYNLLAAPLYGPGSPTWPAVRSGEWAAALDGVLRSLGLNQATPQPGDDVAEAFHRTFVEPGHPLIPVESVHKVWTEASGADLLCSHEKGWLGGDSARHMAWLYEQTGIAIPPEMVGTPDHLALELEFMGLLAEMGLPEQQALFRRQHLDWVADLVAQADQPAISPFYRDLLRLIAAVVAQADT